MKKRPFRLQSEMENGIKWLYSTWRTLHNRKSRTCIQLISCRFRPLQLRRKHCDSLVNNKKGAWVFSTNYAPWGAPDDVFWTDVLFSSVNLLKSYDIPTFIVFLNSYNFGVYGPIYKIFGSKLVATYPLFSLISFSKGLLTEEKEQQTASSVQNTFDFKTLNSCNFGVNGPILKLFGPK